MNEKDELWFGENYAFKIGMFDTKTKQFKEWDDPTPWNAVYDAVSDKTGYVWAAGWTTGLVSRLNPRHGNDRSVSASRIQRRDSAGKRRQFRRPPDLLGRGKCRTPSSEGGSAWSKAGASQV